MYRSFLYWTFAIEAASPTLLFWPLPPAFSWWRFIKKGLNLSPYRLFNLLIIATTNATNRLKISKIISKATIIHIMQRYKLFRNNSTANFIKKIINT